MTNPFLKIHDSDNPDNDAEKFDAFLLELYEKYKKVGANSYSLNQFELIKALNNAKIGRRFGLRNDANKECYLLEVQYAHRYNEITAYERARMIEEYRTYPFYLFQPFDKNSGRRIKQIWAMF